MRFGDLPRPEAEPCVALVDFYFYGFLSLPLTEAVRRDARDDQPVVLRLDGLGWELLLIMSVGH